MQKYNLHRNRAGGFTATFPNGDQWSGDLESIKKMFDEPETPKNVFRFRNMDAPSNTTSNTTSTTTARWVREGTNIPVSYGSYTGGSNGL